MEREREGRFSVEDIKELFALFIEITDRTRLSREDQAKLGAVLAKLNANNQAVADALKP